MSTTIKVSLPEIVAGINNVWPVAGLTCVLLTNGAACLTSASVVLLSFEDGKSNLTFLLVILSSSEYGESRLTFFPLVLTSIEDGKSNLTFLPIILSSIDDGESILAFVPCGGWPLLRKCSRDWMDPWPTEFTRFSLTETYPDPFPFVRRGRKYSED